MQILASGKTAENKYELREIDPTKNLSRLDVRQIATSNQFALEATQGFSYSGEEGSSSALDDNLSIIDVGNLEAYKDDLAKVIQTLVANNSFLEVYGGSTANSIILQPRKIADIASPNGNNYSKLTPLPFAFRDNLKFTFRATTTNTGPTQFSIPALAGLSGSIDAINESGNPLVEGDIVAGRLYEIYTTGTSGTKKVILRNGGLGTAAYKNTGIASGNVPLIGTSSATTSLAGLSSFATSAEIIAGTNNTKSITPAALAGSVSFVKGTTGYEKNAQGFIRQFGVVFLAGGAATTITLPIAFPNVFTGAFAQAESENTNEDPAGAVRATLSQVRISNGFGSPVNIMWEAYGY